MPVTVIDVLGPKNAGDFAVADDEHFLGGFRSVANLAARDAITTQRRREGMRVLVRDVRGVFRLEGGITDTDWVLDSGPSNTEETGIIINVDSGSGTDQAARVFDTASAAAYGSFATVGSAVASLPPILDHNIEIRLTDGIHIMGSETDFARFAWGLGGKLGPFPENGFVSFTSLNGRVIQAGTVAMAVTSSAGIAGAHVVTLAADPSLTADAFRSTYLEVTTGTGAGQFKPIRSHTGAAFSVAGTFNPALDATSVVEIRAPAAQIQIAETGLRFIFARHGIGVGIDFKNIDVIKTGAVSFTTWDGGSVFLNEGARVIDQLWDFRDANLVLGDCVIANEVLIGLNMLNFEGGFIRTKTGSSAPALIRSVLPTAIQIFSRAQSSGAFLFGGHQFDGFTASVLKLDGPLVSCDFGSSSGATPASDGVATYAAEIKNGAIYQCNAGDLALLDASFTGATDDVLFDGVSTSWSTADADPNDTLLGVKGSRITARL